MTKKERRKARHQRRVSRRALLKTAGAAVATIVASIIPFRMVHRECTLRHPTWDHLLNHYGRRPELDQWVNGLVREPSKPQPALLLVGPNGSGKSTFHQAMELLLPENAVAHYPDQWPATRTRYAIKRGEVREIHPSQIELARLDEMMKRVWLVIVSGQTECCAHLFGVNHWNDGRILKWCLTNTRDVDPIPNVQRHYPELLESTIPKFDLLRRLEDERDAFRQRLLRFAA